MDMQTEFVRIKDIPTTSYSPSIRVQPSVYANSGKYIHCSLLLFLKDPPRLSVQSLPFNYLGWKHLVEVSLMILKITDLKWEGMEVADPQTTCPIGIRNFM
jgi:hypothetical protein